MTLALPRPARAARSAPRRRVSWRERDPVRIGVVGVAATVVILVVLFNAHALVSVFRTYDLEAVLAEAGGLKSGDDVRLLGQNVGQVTSVGLDGATVLVKFQVNRGISLGGQTAADVKTATALGVKFLALVPAGDGALRGGDRIPLERTKSAYDLTQTLAELTRTAQGVDSEKVAQALDEISKTFDQTPNEFGRALEGVQGLSTAIADRDAELKQVFSRTAQLTGTLNQRRDQIAKLLSDGETLAAELTSQQVTIQQMVQQVSELVAQLQGLVKDGRTALHPALTQLDRLLALLLKNQANLQDAITTLPGFARALGESVGNGPFFSVYMGNLTPEGFPVFRQ